MGLNALYAIGGALLAPHIAKAVGMVPPTPQAPVMTAAPNAQAPGGTSTGANGTGGTPEAEAQYKAQQQRQRVSSGGMSSTIATAGGKGGLGEVPQANRQTKTLLGY